MWEHWLLLLLELNYAAWSYIKCCSAGITFFMGSKCDINNFHCWRSLMISCFSLFLWWRVLPFTLFFTGFWELLSLVFEDLSVPQLPDSPTCNHRLLSGYLEGIVILLSFSCFSSASKKTSSKANNEGCEIFFLVIASGEFLAEIVQSLNLFCHFSPFGISL